MTAFQRFREHFCSIMTWYSAKELQWWQVYLHYAHEHSDFHRPTVSGLSSCLCYCFLLTAQHPSPASTVGVVKSHNYFQVYVDQPPLAMPPELPLHPSPAADIFTKRYSDSSYIQHPLFTLYFQIYISKIPRVVNNLFFLPSSCFTVFCCGAMLDSSAEAESEQPTQTQQSASLYFMICVWVWLTNTFTDKLSICKQSSNTHTHTHKTLSNFRTTSAQ